MTVITKEFAEKHSACGRGLKLFERYPEGFTVDDVYSGKITNIPMVHIAWAFSALPFTEEEREKIIEFLKIKNSSSYYCSWDLDNSFFIEHSSHCKDSRFVTNSSDVTNSSHVDYSGDVNDATYVYSSHFVYDGAHIVKSTNVQTGLYIFSSKNINRGYGIHNSTNLTDVICCDDCHDGEFLMFCRGLKGIKNRILCDENAVGEYCIGNIEVPQPLFEKTWSRLEEIILKEPYYYTVDLTNPDWSKITPSLVIWANFCNAKNYAIFDALPSLVVKQTDFLYSLIPSSAFIHFNF